MRRWPAFSTDHVTTGVVPALWFAVVVVGVLSERAAYDWSDLRTWMPDLVVGLVFIGCGLLIGRNHPGAAALMVATGSTWFLANLWPAALFVHRGLLVHLLVAFPSALPRTTIGRIGVIGFYVAAVVLPVWRNERVAIVLACVAVACVAEGLRGSAGEARRARLVALQATVVLAGVMVVGSIVRLIDGSVRPPALVTLSYQVALCFTALWLTRWATSDRPSAVADLVVELGDDGSGTMRGALAAALDDPDLELGYWSGSDYVDGTGRPITAPAAGSARTATYVDRDGLPFAAIVHDSSILSEPEVVESVVAATRLSSTNRELNAVVAEQLAELSASRRRLVTAADAERRRLDDRLRAGAERHLRQLETLLQRDCPDFAGTERARRITSLLEHTIGDLHELAAGLHPRELALGLEAALRSLAARSPTPVDVEVSGVEPDRDVGTAIYFVCAEGLANAIKHGRPTSISVRVNGSEGMSTLDIQDDGRGGAEVERGTGLRGLVDRVEALDGSLSIVSEDGRGTRLRAEFPRTVTLVESGQP